MYMITIKKKKFRKCFQHIAIFKAGAIRASPAKTGNDNNNKTAVTNIAQTNKGSLCKDIPFVLIFNVVLIKLIA